MTELWLAPWAPGWEAQRPGSLRSPAEPGDVPAPCGNILEIARSGPRRTGGTAFHQLRGGHPAVLCRQVSALFLLPFRCVTFVSSDFFLQLLVARSWFAGKKVRGVSGSFQALRCGRFVAGIAREPHSNSAGVRRGHPAGADLRRGSREGSTVSLCFPLL